MHSLNVLQVVKNFVADEFLEGRDIGLEATTPLLEWGIIDSIAFLRLINFIEERFGVEVPAEKAVPDNFKDLEAITNLVLETTPVA